MPKKVATWRLVGNIQYRLVGGQPNGKQVTLQERPFSLQLENLPKFRATHRFLKIIQENGSLVLVDLNGRHITPQKGVWPQEFLQEHLNSIKGVV